MQHYRTSSVLPLAQRRAEASDACPDSESEERIFLQFPLPITKDVSMG